MRKPVARNEPSKAQRYKVYCVAFDPTGQRIATGSEDQEIRLWDAATGAPSAVLQGHTGPVYGVAYSPDGRLLASAGGDETVRLWNPRTGNGGSQAAGPRRPGVRRLPSAPTAGCWLRPGWTRPSGSGIRPPGRREAF